MRDDPAADEIDEMSAHTGPYHVRAHHEDDRCAASPRCDNPVGQRCQIRMGKGQRRVVGLQPVPEVEVVDAFSQRLELQSRSVKLWVSRSHALAPKIGAGLPASKREVNRSVS
jgi:hypothetical protein